MLGTTVTVETLHDEETLRVPAGTSPGHEFRLRGQGVPQLRGEGKGDHVVHVALEVPRPKDLSDEQIDLLRQMATLEDVEVSDHHGVLDKVKKIFS